MKKIKGKVLIFLAKLSGVMMILSACALDSDSLIPLIICGVSVTYLALFIYANSRE